VTDLTPEGIVRSYFNALNARDFARAAGPIAEDCEWTSVATGRVFRGPAAILAGLREFTTSFPDWLCELERLHCMGDVVVAEWVTSGTFRNEFRGRPANGRAFLRRGCAVAEVRQGKIVRYRDYYDRASLLEQLDLRDPL
jgi:steroid delta-isomerase-like uncharacterized protein